MDSSEAFNLIKDKVMALPVPVKLKYEICSWSLTNLVYLDESKLSPEELSARRDEQRQICQSPVMGLIIPSFVAQGPYAIRDSDLNLLLLLSTGLGGLSIFKSLSTTGEGALAVQIVNAMVEVVMIARNMREKLIPLTNDECRLLTFMKVMGPSTLEAITSAMNGIYRPEPHTAVQVEDLLKRLRALRTRKGHIVALVADTSDGLWGVTDL